MMMFVDLLLDHKRFIVILFYLKIIAVSFDIFRAVRFEDFVVEAYKTSVGEEKNIKLRKGLCKLGFFNDYQKIRSD